jgi:hypothetical protein
VKKSNALVLLLLLAVFTGCGSDSSTSRPNNNNNNDNPSARAPQGSTIYFGTQSPGDAWEIILKPDNTFTATNMTTTSVSFSGTYEVNSSNGLISFSVTTINGQAQTVTVFGAQIAGSALSLIPPGTNSNPIVAFAEGANNNFDACSTVASDHIGVGIPPADYSLTNSSPAYVQIATQTSGSNFSFTMDVHNLDGSLYDTQGGGTVFTCTNGLLSSAQDPAKAVVAESGAFAVDLGQGKGGFAGVPTPSAAIDLTGSSGVVTKQFLGSYYHSNTHDAVIAGASGDPGNTKALSLGGFESPASDAFTAHGTEFTIDFTNATQQIPGLIQGATVNGNPAIIVANTVGTKVMIIGLSTDTGSTDPIVFSLMEK